MAKKAAQKSPVARAKVRVRGGSDRERSMYVKVRRALAPRTTRTRLRAARAVQASGFDVPADKGFTLLPPGTFPEAADVAAFARERLAALEVDALAREANRKQFMMPLVDQAELTRESPLLQLPLREDVLSAAAVYLGTAPLLTSVNLYLSRPTGRKDMSSQLLHCDADDTRQMKLFALCNDVTPASGPLMLMDAATSEELRRRVGYTYRSRVEDGEAREALGDFGMTAMQGPEGTVALVDTSRCFHYGSRVEADAPPRVLLMLQFLTPHSFMLPRNPTAKAPFKHLVRPGDSQLVRLALGG